VGRRKGQFFEGLPLRDCLKEMGPGDHFIKGVNVINCKGNAGVLMANADGGMVRKDLSYVMEKIC